MTNDGGTPGEGQVTTGLLNLHEYEEAARTRLPRMFFDYIAGAAWDQRTLRANRAAFDQWRFVPRVMRGITECSLATTVLGRPVSMPVILAPVGMHRVAHDEGEVATARAARAAGTIFTVSTMATRSIEEIAPEAGTWWFQLYVFKDRGISRDLVQRAVAAGASALVLTVDTPMVGRREADERNRFALPEGVILANLARTEHEDMPAGESGSGISAYAASTFEPALSWRDVEWLASLSDLPLILKGVLAAEDARLAIEHGVSAIVVSNHGGRQLDGAVATIDALPSVVAAVDGRAEVLLDGGIRRGTDVLTALALGARAVLIGRPYVWGLAVGGEAGVQHVLELLRSELSLAMMLAGCGEVQQVDRSLVVPAGPLR